MKKVILGMLLLSSASAFASDSWTLTNTCGASPSKVSYDSAGGTTNITGMIRIHFERSNASGTYSYGADQVSVSRAGTISFITAKGAGYGGRDGKDHGDIGFIVGGWSPPLSHSGTVYSLEIDGVSYPSIDINALCSP